ncbi:MAG: DUF2911 domain-containing protein [Flavobacteriaceae bacterium]|nr:DUF2911 domain-containing protein [Flavobacteriaceae bacterium]
MKKFLLIACMVVFTYTANAQITTPQPSPFSKIEQKVGLTDVTLEFSRPGMRGRTIFGDLVPFGKTWRTGANANTKITFSTDVTVNGQTLKAGSYAIYTIPNKGKWEVLFYADSNNWGTPGKWDDSKVVAKASVQTYPMPMNIETYTMSFDDLTSSSAVIGILWEKTYVGIQFEVPTDAAVLKSITSTLSGPSARDYYNAAVYYSQQDKDIKKAGEWMEKAMSMTEKPAFWQLRQQSLIYAKMGSKKKAIATAKKSLELSKVAKNADYVKMNTDSLKEWGAK